MQWDLQAEKLVRAGIISIPGIGSQRLRQLIAQYGSAAKALQVPEELLMSLGNSAWLQNFVKYRGRIDPDLLEKRLKNEDIKLVIPLEDNYPKILNELPDAPPLLFYRGELTSQKEVLAIVGSRRATAYGKSAANFLAKEVASQGIIVASGLARGIDTAAHEGTLAAGGITWAFLGCGIDIVYPPENKGLAEKITVQGGAIISEFSLGTPPEAQNFPARNRLISGCSKGVVVIEAELKSGALITVDFALEQGREVFAVPGPIFSTKSRGTHQLLRMGAKLVENFADISAEIPVWSESDSKVPKSKSVKPGVKTFDPLCVSSTGECGTLLLELLSDMPMHIDQIVMNCHLQASEVALSLLELQLAGRIEQLPGQFYVLARV